MTDADNRVNTGSTNYKTGYSNGVTYADGRANSDSTNYKAGYNTGHSAGYSNGVSDADGRANPDSTNYKSGYNSGYSDAKKTVTMAAYKVGTIGSSNYNEIKKFNVASLGSDIYSKLTKYNFSFIPTGLVMHNNTGTPSQTISEGFSIDYNPDNATLSICMGYTNGYNLSSFLAGDIYCTYPN